MAKGERTLKFSAVQEQTELADTLEMGTEFALVPAPIVPTHGQVNQVTGSGWDPQYQDGNSRPESRIRVPVRSARIGEQGRGGELAETCLRPSRYNCCRLAGPTHSPRPTNLAQSFIDSRRNDRGPKPTGLCFGNPECQGPGKKVEVKGMGHPVLGETITSTGTTHTFSSAEGFTSQFVCSGKNPEHPPRPPRWREQRAKRNYGGYIVIGPRTDNKDEEKPGRESRSIIPVACRRFRKLLDSHGVHRWRAAGGESIILSRGRATRCSFGFEHGDIHRAYRLGALWNGPRPPSRGE